MSAARLASREGTLRLRLFVAGESPNSVAALRHLRALLAAHPSLTVELEVVDVLGDPERALREGVLVTPTMVRLSPTPRRQVVGTLRDAALLASVLGLTEGRDG